MRVRASNWFRHLHPRDDALLLLLLEMDVPCVTDPCNRARNNRGSDRSVALGYVNKRRWPANVIDKGSSAHLPKVTMHSGSLSWGVRVKHRRYKHRPINLLAPLGNETESSRFFFSSSPRYKYDAIPSSSWGEERARVWRNDCSVNVDRECNLEFLITIPDRIANSVVEKHIFEVDRLFEWKRTFVFVLSFLWKFERVFLLMADARLVAEFLFRLYFLETRT